MPNFRPDFSALSKKWPSPYVARQEVEKFKCGIFNVRTIANHDSQGLEPKGRIKVGRKSPIPWLN